MYTAVTINKYNNYCSMTHQLLQATAKQQLKAFFHQQALKRKSHRGN
jgi:hypothetical protein